MPIKKKKEDISDVMPIDNPPKEEDLPVEPTEESEEGLTLKQMRFCHFYVRNSETRGNLTLSYALAYDMGLEEADRTRETDEEGKEIRGTSEYDKIYDQCSMRGSRNARKDKIQDYIRKLWLEMMNDEHMDARLTEIAISSRDEVSLRAVQEYNKMKGRILDRTKDESDSDKAKVELLKEMKDKLSTMDSKDLALSIQELLTKK